MDIDAAFETQPNTPARVQATPGDEVRMEVAKLRRSVASNTREIRKNRERFTVGTPRTPRNPNERSYSFKPSAGPIWNASFGFKRGQKPASNAGKRGTRRR